MIVPKDFVQSPHQADRGVICRAGGTEAVALVVEGVCVLRYDNELGKGDHRHWGETEVPYVFTDIDQLVADSFNDVTRWHHEHGND